MADSTPQGGTPHEGGQASGQGEQRRARLAAARLYLVTPVPGEPPDAGRLPDLLRAAVAGGTEIVQLREKRLPDDELTAVANAARALCERIGALLIVNDRPAVAVEAGADGVHVGQEDMPVDQVRELVGPDMLIGLSTHARAEIDAADPALVDYIGVGPVHQTPTKEGRPAVGVELVRYAAANARVPFFAIGGLDAGNIAEVTAAGASRAVVLRAIADAADPEAAARELRAALGAGAGR
jgi:thiamine-phosphate pyrophosphorylase